MFGLLPSVLLSILALSCALEQQEADCVAPALIQADLRDAEVQTELVEEANSSNASKGGNTSKNLSVSNTSKIESGEKHGNTSKNLNVSNKSKKESGRKHVANHSEKRDERHGANHTQNNNVTDAESLKMPSYADADINKDGVLTPNEFQQKTAGVIREIEEKIHTILKHEDKLKALKLSLERNIDEMPAYEDLDKNRDGVMTPAEYRTSSDTAMSKDLSYKSLDQNSDGTVTPEEFKAASEKWAAEMTNKVQTKVKELAKAREERRQLEQQIDRMQSYKDLDVKRDGVVTPAEYAKEAKAAHGAWSVDEKAGAVANGLGLAGVSALFFAL